MRAALLGIVIGGVLTGLTQSRPSLACGQEAPPYYVVSGQAPTGAAVPLNAPLVITLSASAASAASPAAIDNPSLTLTKAGSATNIDLKAIGGPGAPIYLPTEPLEPSTSYEARFSPGYEGVADTVWPFTTGTESAPALSLTGKLEVSLEPGTDMVQECITSCGFPCTNKGEINVTKARVKLPRSRDGFAARSGTLWLTDDKPADPFERSKTGPEPYRGNNVSLARYVNLEDPSVTEVVLTVPSEAVAYKPCFAFVASDARGDTASAEPLCLEASTFPTMNRAGAGGGGNNVAGAGSAGSPTLDPNGDPGFANDIQKSGTSTSCSLGRGPWSDGAWLLVLGPLAMLGAWRRRLGR